MGWYGCGCGEVGVGVRWYGYGCGCGCEGVWCGEVGVGMENPTPVQNFTYLEPDSIISSLFVQSVIFGHEEEMWVWVWAGGCGEVGVGGGCWELGVGVGGGRGV